ncbi:MAG TPA: hypothetical protein ENJ80_06945 [Gammaproteobacteria bacterium]|nr:hypothetical protein [Gammaproteobacteria bacterium]
MKMLLRTCLSLSLLFTPLLTLAVTKVAGTELADSYRLADSELVLNGAGVRSKFFFKIYVGALYTGKRSSDAGELLAAEGPKSMQMTMLYEKVSAEKITKGWHEGFEANLDDAAFKQVEERLKTFNSLFPDLHEGDVVRMDYIPGSGTRLSINDKQLGTIPGADFFKALLKVWIGKHPADDDLKEGLLGD